jgi:osmotically-inducible protein OsmY
MSAETGTVNPLHNGVPWPVDIETTELVVTVENGVLALTGRVRCCIRPGEFGEEEPRTADVVDEMLEVRAPFAFKRADIEIARDAAGALRRSLPCSCEHVRLAVKDGWLTLDGELEWNYQRERIGEAVMPLAGIVGISDRTRLCSQIDPIRIRERIKAAQRGRTIPQR